MAKKKLPNKVFMWAIIAVSFGLAILDMFFLRDVLSDNLGFDPIGASIIALALATAANATALLWGRQKGLREAWKSFMVGWIFLGITYAALRSVSFVNNVVLCNDWSFDSIMEQLIPAIVLTISYVGTGTMLQWAGSRLWDYDAVNYLEARKAFKSAHAKVINNRVAILEMAKRLNEYGKNYTSLDHQYDIHMEKIRKNEHSTMSLIVAKTIADHPEISPTAANKVMNDVLGERDRQNARAHSKQK